MSKLVNLSVSAAGRRFSVKLDEETCNDAFEDIVLSLLGYDTEREDAPNVQIEVEVAPDLREPIPYVAPEPIVKKEVAQRSISAPSALPQRYRGFLYVECAGCKLHRGFNARQEISTYRCKECDFETQLEHLTPLRVLCECGGRFKYQTNIQVPLFDIECLNCGMPVSVEYHEKNQRYETIGAR